MRLLFKCVFYSRASYKRENAFYTYALICMDGAKIWISILSPKLMEHRAISMHKRKNLRECGAGHQEWWYMYSQFQDLDKNIWWHFLSEVILSDLFTVFDVLIWFDFSSLLYYFPFFRYEINTVWSMSE